MSNYKDGDTDPLGFQLIKRSGHIELWRNPTTRSWKVYLYEHIGVDEGWLMHSTRYNEEDAEGLYDSVVDLLR